MPRYIAALLLLLLAGPFNSMRAQSCTATVETVARQVGESVVFCGTPSEVHASNRPDGPVHVNFGGTWPDVSFTVIIFPDVAGDVPALVKRLEGKSVQVTGLVKDYKGKPEIVLKKLNDLVVQE
ncbi:MAG: hypothetical protein JST45_05140 [Bacteroidetes bacterium]|nr:hypothetical protein [Bacteroidota bacterium]